MMESKANVKQVSASAKEIGEFFGRMYTYNNCLKLYRWHVSGTGSYAEHMALDQALAGLTDILDHIVETSYALYGNIRIVIPETSAPFDVVEYSEKFSNYINNQRDLFAENFIAAILDDYQETIQQLLYRLKRLI